MLASTRGLPEATIMEAAFKEEEATGALDMEVKEVTAPGMEAEEAVMTIEAIAGRHRANLCLFNMC